MTAKQFKALIRNTFCAVTTVASLLHFFNNILTRPNVVAMPATLQIGVGIVWVAGTILFISGAILLCHSAFVSARWMAKRLPIQPTAPDSRIKSTFGTWLAEIDTGNTSAETHNSREQRDGKT